VNRHSARLLLMRIHKYIYIMNYTARIIKPINGGTETSNHALGDHYYTYYKTHKGDYVDPEKKNIFQELSDQYFKDSPEVPPETDISDEVIGFVCASDGKLHPFWDYNQVYIVNENGKTFERVYGMPKKR